MKHYSRLSLVLFLSIIFYNCDEILDGGEFHQLNGTWTLTEVKKTGISLTPPTVSGTIVFSQEYEDGFVVSVSINAFEESLSYTTDWIGGDYTVTIDGETYSYSLDEDDTKLTISNFMGLGYDWIFNN